MSVQLEVGKSYRDAAKNRVDIKYHVDGVTDGRDYVGVVHTGYGVILRTFERDGTSISGPSILSVWPPTIAPGWWECRDVKKVCVAARLPDEIDTHYKWIGAGVDGEQMSWMDDGRFDSAGERRGDLIRPTTAPKGGAE